MKLYVKMNDSSQLIDADSIKAENTFIFAYLNDNLVGVFDLGIVEFMCLVNKNG